MTSTAPARQVAVGDRLTPFTRATGFATWNRYAAVNDEFVPIHMDDEAGQAAGYASAFGMGNLQWAYLHNLVRDWMGEEGRLISITCQFRGPNTKGQVVTARGEVTTVDDVPEGRKVTLRIWTEEQDGNALAPGTAEVLLPR